MPALHRRDYTPRGDLLIPSRLLADSHRSFPKKITRHPIPGSNFAAALNPLKTSRLNLIRCSDMEPPCPIAGDSAPSPGRALVAAAFRRATALLHRSPAIGPAGSVCVFRTGAARQHARRSRVRLISISNPKFPISNLPFPARQPVLEDFHISEISTSKNVSGLIDSFSVQRYNGFVKAF
jgi:hypothetical protein